MLSKHLSGENEDNHKITQDDPFQTRDLNQGSKASAEMKKNHARSALVTIIGLP